MVGQRSTGCRKCVERKVKCDQTRPRCARCNRLGLLCPGYLPTVVFLDPATVPRRKPAKSTSREDTPISESENLLVSHSLSRGSAEDAGFLQNFLSDTPPRLWYTKSWIAGICRSPTDRTLETALRALITAHGAMKMQNDSLMIMSQHAYGDSLRSLSGVVVHPPRDKLNEVQNSILMLTICEFYQKCLENHATEANLKVLMGNSHSSTGKHPSTWLHHAGGIEQVMRRQGPEAYLGIDNNRLFYVAMRDTLVSLGLFMEGFH